MVFKLIRGCKANRVVAFTLLKCLSIKYTSLGQKNHSLFLKISYYSTIEGKVEQKNPKL